MDGSIGQACYG